MELRPYILDADRTRAGLGQDWHRRGLRNRDSDRCGVIRGSWSSGFRSARPGRCHSRFLGQSSSSTQSRTPQDSPQPSSLWLCLAGRHHWLVLLILHGCRNRWIAQHRNFRRWRSVERPLTLPRSRPRSGQALERTLWSRLNKSRHPSSSPDNRFQDLSAGPRWGPLTACGLML